MNALYARFTWIGYILCIAMLLGGCAGSRHYAKAMAAIEAGKDHEALSELEAAVQAQPHNAQYRIALHTHRATQINTLNARADEYQRRGQLSEAEKHYRQVLGLDSGNAVALTGMQTIATHRAHKELLEQAQASLKQSDPQGLEHATTLTRRILSENPQHTQARALHDQITQIQAQQTKATEPQLGTAFKKTVTLEFKDTPLRSIFDVISRMSGLNFFFDKDVRTDQRATIMARDTSIEDAVRILLSTNQLEHKVLNDSSLLVYPANPQKQREYQALSIRSFYLTNADVKAVSNTLRTLLKTKDLVVDERLGLIIMRDTPEAITLAERIIQLQDMADSEVMLEVEVLEIKRSRLLELGIKWPQQANFNVLNTANDRLTLEGLRNLNSSGIGVTLDQAVINARKDDTDSNILANPRIRVRNRDKARIVIGDRVPVITTTSTSTGFVSDSVSYLDVGLRVEVEPTIFLDHEVAIKVSLEVSNLVREVTSRSGTLSYQVGTRNASTVLRLRDGETQILAGLINQEDRSASSKVPGLGDFPLLGRLFGSHKDDSQSTEIVLSITPRILRTIKRPDLLTAQFAAGTEASLGARALAIGTNPSPATEASTPPTAASSPSAPPQEPAANSTNALPTTTQVTATAGTSTPPTSTSPTPSANAANSSPTSGAVARAVQSYTWQGPSDVKAGEQFNVVLRLQSIPTVQSIPFMIGYDPTTLQLANVMEGDFMRQGDTKTTFSSRIDPVQGRAFLALVRQAQNSQDTGANGEASLVTLVFKAIKAQDNVRVQLLSSTPEPAPSAWPTLPIDFHLNIKQP